MVVVVVAVAYIAAPANDVRGTSGADDRRTTELALARRSTRGGHQVRGSWLWNIGFGLEVFLGLGGLA